MLKGMTGIILTVVNVVFLLVGLGLLITGTLFRVDTNIVRIAIQTGLDKSGASMTETTQLILNTAFTAIQEMVAPVSEFLISIGLIIIVITVMAFVGIGCSIKLLVIVYAILVAAIFTTHLIVLIIYFAKKEIIMVHVDDGFMKLVRKYESISSNTVESVALSILMPALQCCGYHSGDDFKEPDVSFTGGDEYHGNHILNLEYPLPCCKPKFMGIQKDQCPASFTPENSYVIDGCRPKLIDVVNEIMLSSIVALVVETAILVLTIIHLASWE